MLTAILKSLRTGVVTIRYPRDPAHPPERFRGAPGLRAGGTLARLPPPTVCPSGAITGQGASGYAIDLGRCIFCGRCAEDSPDGAIEMGTLTGFPNPPAMPCSRQSRLASHAIELGRQVELAARKRESLVVRIEEGGPVARPSAPPGPEVAKQIRRTLGRSLALRHLDAGSCNACDWELTALLNPVYDIRRLGIDFVASPRHADGVIVTGPVTRNLEVAVRRTFEAVPDSRIVIAVGACATSGGIVGRGYASAGGVAEVLPVDVFIPGCPPRPEAIIFGILLAVGRIAERRA